MHSIESGHRRIATSAPEFIAPQAAKEPYLESGGLTPLWNVTGAQLAEEFDAFPNR